MSEQILKLSFVVLLALVSSVAILPADAAVTRIDEHVFAKGIYNEIQPIGVTTTFTQDDAYVYAFTRASFSRTNFTWRWYEPSGALYQTHSAVFECRGECEFYDSLAILGSDAATKTGQWRMDLLADGLPLYSDVFQLVPYVEEAYSWIFNLILPTHAVVILIITIHPYGQDWKDDSIYLAYSGRPSNVLAYDYGTNKPLGVVLTPQNGETWVRVVFSRPEGNGYRFIITFDLDGDFGTIEGDTFLQWSFDASANPIPMNVTVILSSSFGLVSVDVLNYTTSMIDNRTTVSFSGVAPSNEGFGWTVTYGAAQSATATKLASGSPFAESSSSPNDLTWGRLTNLESGQEVSDQ